MDYCINCHWCWLWDIFISWMHNFLLLVVEWCCLKLFVTWCAVVVYWSVVTAHDSESGGAGSNPEWVLVYYQALITAQGLPEPSSLRGSTLGTRAIEHKGCNGACKLIDGCSITLCLATVSWYQLAYATKIKSIPLHDSIEGLSQKIVSITLHYINVLSAYT